jgi:tRNA threonylcarbamoyladenosine biosynthesis protein TsaB
LAYLFLDSSYDITLGLLDSGLEWLEFQKFEGQKASRVLQLESFNFFENHQIDPKHLQGIISVAGPGFYTGLRVSEGFGDIFEFFQIPTYSFYSFEVPAFCGVVKGSWFTKAYRGEYFIADWDGEKVSQRNIPVADLEKVLSTLDHVYIHAESSLDESSLKLIKSYTTTQDLLSNQPKAIISQILKGELKRESFYFRAPEDEFKVNP